MPVRLSLLIVIATSLLAAACSDRHSGYSEFKSLPEHGWVYGEELTFVPTQLDTLAARQVYVAIRHTNDYPYSNLWFELSVLNDSADAVCDTICLTLADDFGRWYGSGIGAARQFQLLMPKPLKVNDSTSIKVRHVMRTDTLRGIEQVGITVDALQE